MPITPIILPANVQTEYPEPDTRHFTPSRVVPAQLRKPVTSNITPLQRLALIVAGVSYPRPSQGNTLVPSRDRTFHKFSINYRDFLLKANRVDEVIVFDFLLGKITYYDLGAKQGGQPSSLTHDPIVVKNYRFHVGSTITLTSTNNKLRKLYWTGIDEFANTTYGDEDADVEKALYDPWTGTTENSMSISDVYRRIRYAIPGTISELHFVGHGWTGGPIIVNTPGYSSKVYDKDGRTSDFSNSNLVDVFGGSNLSLFQKAFTTDATIAIWGCENNEAARKLILSARAKEKAKQAYQSELNQLRQLLNNTYAARLAKATGKDVFSALPGTYAVAEGEPNDDNSGYTFQPTIMHVNLEKCGHILQFYKDKLGATFATNGPFKGHPTFGRGYGIFPP